MKKINVIKSGIILVLLLMIAGCGQGYGKLLEFNGGQLYYTSSVTVDEAIRLGGYLVSEGFFDGKKKTVQINKTESAYEFRMVLQKGFEIDEEYMHIFKEAANELSIHVFEGKQVDWHLCDEHLKTLHVVYAL